VAPGFYWQRVLSTIGIYALLAVSFDFLANKVGLVCIGGAFMTGVGGYISGLLNHYYGVPPAVAMPIATILGTLICTLVWLPCLPLRGIYFAIATFMFPFFAASTILALNLWGGTNGISPIAPLPNIWIEQYLIIAVLFLVVFGLRRLVSEDVGVVLCGVKDNDQSVMASGINIVRVKVFGLLIASGIGCFAGAYLVHLYGYMGPSLFTLDYSVLPIAATVLGGAGSIAGPALGAIILVPLSEVLRGLGQLRVVLYCMILIGFILFKPEGLLSWAARKYHQFEHWVKI
jgi:branched-chain amino acid transport system permease protein